MEVYIMKKKMLALFLSVWLLIAAMTALPVAAAEGTLSGSASSGTVTVGSTVIVTFTYKVDTGKIASILSKIKYNAEKLSLNITASDEASSDGVSFRGDAGVTTAVFECPDSGILPSEAKFSLIFQTEAVGEDTVSLTTEEFKGCESEVTVMQSYDLGLPATSVTVIANNPTKSGNADLKSLVPSKGTLSPKFNPNVTEYTISVNHSVTSLTLSANPDHSEAKTSISGKNALEVGKNTRVITVTAPNGTTKKYTVVITRAAAPSTTSGTATNPSTGTTTTIPTPPEDALEVEVNGKVMTILDTQATVDLPEGFTWSNIAINLVEVPAAINHETGMILLYLTGASQADNDFYIYNIATDSFSRYRRMRVENREYMLYDLPKDQPAPAGVVKGQLAYTNHFVTAYVYEDAALSDFYIVWAAPLDGEAGWYTYDKKEKTLQRYHATPNSDVGVIGPITDKRPTPTKTTAKNDPKKTDAEDSGFSLAALLGEPRQVLLIGGFALVGVAIVTAIILLILSAKKRKNRKYRRAKH